MNIEEFNIKDILGDFEYELNKLCQSCIGTVTEIQIKQQPLISLFHQLVWFYEKEKEKNKKIENELEKHIKFCEQEAEGSLNNEEKKAIESVKDMFEDVTIKDIDEQSITIYGIAMLDVIKVLTIVEKQSKETEELKEKNKTLKNLQNDTNRLYTEMIERKNYFERELQKLVDKIKAKIEELEKQDRENRMSHNYLVIPVLRSLLEKE